MSEASRVFGPRVAAATVLTISAVLVWPGVAYAEGGIDEVDAIEQVAPGVLDTASAVTSSSTGDLVSTTGDGSVTIPLSSNDPILLSANGADVAIGLPIDGSTVDSSVNGAVTYSADGSVSAVVVPQEDSSVVITTVLADSGAPTRFDYTYDGLDLRLTEAGEVLGYSASGDLAVTVAAPWAFDAKGSPVPTHYEAHGSVLTQVVGHHDSAYSYPIVADPTSYGGNWMYSDIVKDSDSRGTVIRVYAQPLNFSHYSNTVIWENYQTLVPWTYETTTMYDQLICHVRNIGRLKQPWNLEPWRADVGYAAVVAAGCNP